jgi:hypothetical protein
MFRGFVITAALLLCSVPAYAVPAIVVSDNVVSTPSTGPAIIVSDDVVNERMGPPVIVSDNVVVEDCEFAIIDTPECDEQSARYRVLLDWQND